MRERRYIYRGEEPSLRKELYVVRDRDMCYTHDLETTRTCRRSSR